MENSVFYSKTSPASTVLAGPWRHWFIPDDIHSLDLHPLLKHLRSSDACLTTARIFLVQHQHYSQYFTRYLCALISNQDTISDVKDLAVNLIEEMGADKDNGRTHAELYLDAMTALGVAPGDAPALAATKELIVAMFEYCRSSNPIDGLAALCLGAEAIVPILYSPIIAAFKKNNLPLAATHFFELHVEEDELHALTMVKIMDRLAAKSEENLARAKSIGSRMIQKRLNFLTAVEREAYFLRKFC